MMWYVIECQIVGMEKTVYDWNVFADWIILTNRKQKKISISPKYHAYAYLFPDPNVQSKPFHEFNIQWFYEGNWKGKQIFSSEIRI